MRRNAERPRGAHALRGRRHHESDRGLRIDRERCIPKDLALRLPSTGRHPLRGGLWRLRPGLRRGGLWRGCRSWWRLCRDSLGGPGSRLCCSRRLAARAARGCAATTRRACGTRPCRCPGCRHRAIRPFGCGDYLETLTGRSGQLHVRGARMCQVLLEVVAQRRRLRSARAAGQCSERHGGERESNGVGHGA